MTRDSKLISKVIYIFSKHCSTCPHRVIVSVFRIIESCFLPTWCRIRGLSRNSSRGMVARREYKTNIYCNVNWHCDLVAPLNLMSRDDCHQKVNTRHDDVIKWKHFPRNLPFVRAIHQSPVDSSYHSKYSSYSIWLLPTRVWSYAIGKRGNRWVIFQYCVRFVVHTMLKNTSDCFLSREHLSNCQVRWTVAAQNTMGVVNVSITK